MFGQFLGSLSFGLNYIFLKELDWHFLFLELIIDICGGSVTYYMMEYSYMTDVTAPHQRTLRIALVEGADYAAVSVGNGVSGPLFVSAGYK